MSMIKNVFVQNWERKKFEKQKKFFMHELQT